jgi:hypothetical protein
MTSTEAGIQIDFREESFEKTIISIRFSFEPLSKATTESLMQEKDWSQRIWTDDGIEIDRNEQLANARRSIRFSFEQVSKFS